MGKMNVKQEDIYIARNTWREDAGGERFYIAPTSQGRNFEKMKERGERS